VKGVAAVVGEQRRELAEVLWELAMIKLDTALLPKMTVRMIVASRQGSRMGCMAVSSSYQRRVVQGIPRWDGQGRPTKPNHQNWGVALEGDDETN